MEHILGLYIIGLHRETERERENKRENNLCTQSKEKDSEYIDMWTINAYGRKVELD